MNLDLVLRAIDARTARRFVEAARHVVDALLIEAERVRQTQTPAPLDYSGSAGLNRAAPVGGWIATDELRAATQRMSEALAAEKWREGFTAAVAALVMIGGGA
ncbi:MAG: hypothetical protein HRU75_13845 [Planctomycetia bacterium]|nr:MAG: hypothetical protein HRU75_13845 [Planctomycetia bacterium]